MPSKFSGPTISDAEDKSPTAASRSIKISGRIIGLIVLITALAGGGTFLFSRNSGSGGGSFDTSGNLEDSSFITPTPIPVVEAKACLPLVTGRQTLAQACVSDPAPRQYTSVTLYTRLIVDGHVALQASMETKWDFKYFDNSCRGLASNSPDGIISCTIDIGNATKNFTVMINVTFTNSDGKVYRATTSFTTEPEATVKPAGNPAFTPGLTEAAVTSSAATSQKVGVAPSTTPTLSPSPPTTLKSQQELPCIALEKFSLTYGPYKDNLGKKACLEGIIDNAGARVPGGAVHITFKGYADIEGIIPADIRVRFDKAAIEKLHNQKVRLHGTFGLSSLIKVPVLTVELPEQIEVIS